jgi:hypothetical protein
MPATAKFYHLTNLAVFNQFVKGGPFPTGAGASNSYRSLRRLPRGYQNPRAKFPGVYTPARPARGQLLFPAAAGITNNALITLNDGVNPAVVFSLHKSGGTIGGTQVVNLTASVTAADVATQFAGAVENYTTTLADPKGGFLASTNDTGSGATTGQIWLVQTGNLNAFAGASDAPFAGNTYGAFGNIAIILGAGTGVTGAFGMSGGLQLLAGIAAYFVFPGHRWVMCGNNYVAPIKGGGG